MKFTWYGALQTNRTWKLHPHPTQVPFTRDQVQLTTVNTSPLEQMRRGSTSPTSSHIRRTNLKSGASWRQSCPRRKITQHFGLSWYKLLLLRVLTVSAISPLGLSWWRLHLWHFLPPRLCEQWATIPLPSSILVSVPIIGRAVFKPRSPRRTQNTQDRTCNTEYIIHTAHYTLHITHYTMHKTERRDTLSSGKIIIQSKETSATQATCWLNYLWQWLLSFIPPLRRLGTKWNTAAAVTKQMAQHTVSCYLFSPLLAFKMTFLF